MKKMFLIPLILPIKSKVKVSLKAPRYTVLTPLTTPLNMKNSSKDRFKKSSKILLIQRSLYAQ